MTSSASRAPVTTSTMSSWHHGVSSPLMRIGADACRPSRVPVSALTAVTRADSLADGAHASSRSRNTRSAPARAATSHMCSLLAGVASSLSAGSRFVSHSRSSDGPAARSAVEPIGVQAEQVRYTLSLSAPSRAPEMLDAAGRFAQHRDRCLNRHRAKIRIVDRRPRCRGRGGARRPAVAARRRPVRPQRLRRGTPSSHGRACACRSIRRPARRSRRPAACRGIGSTYSGRSARSGRSMARYTLAAMLDDALEMAIQLSSDVR